MKNPGVRKDREVLSCRPQRVVAKFYDPGGSERTKNLIDRVMRLSDDECTALYADVMDDFSYRHKRLDDMITLNYERISHLIAERSLSPQKKKLLGAFFTHEYSIESTALFNPSIVPHPDQAQIPSGSLRFIMSLRAVGEGHISSLVFRSGVIDQAGRVAYDPGELFAELPSVNPDPLLTRDTPSPDSYELSFHPESTLAERVIFPVLKEESKGLEDMRFVRFTDDDGHVGYYATYTAYDGHHILSKLLETEDFLTFRMSRLSGSEVAGKGMALFPRKLKGKYVMISRQDGEMLYYMESSDLMRWDAKRLLRAPRDGWELMQIGNCGSPIETERGWILITHGVGPMRKYCIGVDLLDLDDPSRVIARLPHPLIAPDDYEREGYVPNVVYTCGALRHGSMLMVPYGISDVGTRFSMVRLEELLASLSPVSSDYSECTKA